jgi:rhodanese-related sulfurtransferase
MFARLMGLKTISPGDLQQLLKDKLVITVDVNSRQSWLRAHIPGAISLDPGTYTESDLSSDKQSRLVFYCSNPMCRKAPHAARRATKMGYENVHVMSAGITGWLASRLPTEPGEQN